MGINAEYMGKSMGGKKNDQKNNKTIQREKESKVADITFGLKNKNKSKQVQS